MPRLLLICNSEHPKQLEVGCCGNKSPETLIERFEREVGAHGLSKVIIRPSACLNNCSAGATVRVLPGNITYGKVTLEDVAEIVKQHLIQGIPVARLVVADKNRFLDF